MNKLTLTVLLSFASMGLLANTTWDLRQEVDGDLVLPISGSSETEYTITTSGFKGDATVTVNSGTYTFNLEALYCSQPQDVSAPYFHICNGATVTMVLQGVSNNINAGTYGGIIVDEGGKLTIRGQSSLIFSAGKDMAALGFPSGAKGGEIIIESGNLTFASEDEIQLRSLGASKGSTGGKIVIEGGNLFAFGVEEPTIGSSADGTVDTIEINGGTLTILNYFDKKANIVADAIAISAGSIVGSAYDDIESENPVLVTFAPTFTPAPVADGQACYQAVLPEVVEEAEEGELPNPVTVAVKKNETSYFTYAGIGHAYSDFGQFSQNLYFYLPNGTYVVETGGKKYSCEINGAPGTFVETPEPALGLLLLLGLCFLRKNRK